MQWTPVAERLVRRGLVPRQDLEALLERAPAEEWYLGELLQESGLLAEEIYLGEVANHYGIDLIEQEKIKPQADVLSLIPSDYAFRYSLVPLDQVNGTLSVLTFNPSDLQVTEDLRMLTGHRIRMVLGSRKRVKEEVSRAYGASVEKMIAQLGPGEGGEGESAILDISNLQALAKEPTVINLVNLIIVQAIENRASDIHVEPFEKELKVKYRIDGILREMPPPPKHLQPAIISRVKVMANMDIAERYAPQDGQIQMTVEGRPIDFRVSTVPTVYGESLVLRILDKGAILFGVSELGFCPEMERRFLRLVSRSSGIILVTGPTGCGKTTTLYAGLNRIYTPEKKFITIEDPVEYHLDGINQMQVNPKRGLTFATGLRHIVRQDPDVIMVGEIRDRETADIAIRAALTGHLVFSTLHTNSSPGAIARLLDMGVDPYLISSSLAGILAQRLVRKICPDCKVEYVPKSDHLLAMQHQANGHMTFYHGSGCDSCQGVGYRGRTGLFELLVLDDRLREFILTRPSTSQIAKQAGVVPLREDGWKKVSEGTTTIEEVLRVTEEESI
jgi:type II secretion system protein E